MRRASLEPPVGEMTNGPTPEINSSILTAMLAVVEFQLGIFGLTLNLYGVAHKFTKQVVLTRLLLRGHMGRNFVLVGLILVGVGVALVVWEGPGLLAGEVQAAGETERLVLMAFLGVLGLQILVSSLFLSICAKEVADSAAQVGAEQDVSPHRDGIAMLTQSRQPWSADPPRGARWKPEARR